MSLEFVIQYKPSNIKDFEEIDSESVKEMIADIKDTITRFKKMKRGPSFKKTLAYICQGECVLDKKTPSTLDLSYALAIIDKYIQFSETSCDTCEGLIQRLKEDQVSFNYCRRQETYSQVKNVNGRLSPSVRMAQNVPCDHYSQKEAYAKNFSKPLLDLIKELEDNK